MKITIITLLFVISSFVTANDCGASISIESVKKLDSQLTLESLTKKYGAWCQGHGAISWYKTNTEKEVWFYWQKPKIEEANKKDFGHYKLLVATEVNANNENSQEIIWPSQFVGEALQPILESKYK